MKILFLTGVYPDGKGYQGGIFIHNQAVALKQRGHDVSVVYLDFRSLKRNRKIGKEKYHIDDISVYRFSFPCGPIYPLIRLLSPVLAVEQYKFVEKSSGRPDIVHAHFGSAAVYADCIKKKFGVPYVVTEHDSGILTGRISARQLARQKKSYDNASAVIAVSDALRKKLQKLTKQTVKIVHNIVPDYMFYDPKTEKVNSSEFLFISVGNLIKSKSFDLTIRAFSVVAEKRENVRLLIVGTGPEEEWLREIVEHCNVREKVDFVGQIDNKELPKLLSKCDCFVLPSKFETFGVVYAEAMACGLPVIATRCGGPEEFVNEENGILVEVDDEQMLTAAMEYMVCNPNVFARKSVIGYAKNNFSNYNIAHDLERIFSKCID